MFSCIVSYVIVCDYCCFSCHFLKVKICGAGNPRIPQGSAMAQLNDKDLRIMKIN